MTTTERPGLWARLVATLGGEVRADTLEAYRRAGASVYELLGDVEERRSELLLRDTDAWSVDPATQALLLCSWNAFVLQLLGDELLAADYQANRATVGFVPPVTAEQALAFYGQVEAWLSRARQAQANRAYRLDVHVPAELPGWIEVEPCPREHLEAMLSAGRKVRQHAELALADIEKNVPAERDLGRLHQLLAVVTTAADYADQLHWREVGQEVHERIEQSVKESLAAAYLVGQLAAMPSLLASRPERPARGAVGRLPGPGEVGFDPWCLTDPVARPVWQADSRARRAIELLWRFDPQPARTLRIQAELDAALARGDIAYAGDRDGRLGYYFCCPWAPIYLVRRPVRIAGRRLRTMQQFTLDVSAEELAEGGKFRRELVVANFELTSRVDYCDPTGGGHHD